MWQSAPVLGDVSSRSRSDSYMLGAKHGAIAVIKTFLFNDRKIRGLNETYRVWCLVTHESAEPYIEFERTERSPYTSDEPRSRVRQLSINEFLESDAPQDAKARFIELLHTMEPR